MAAFSLPLSSVFGPVRSKSSLRAGSSQRRALSVRAASAAAAPSMPPIEVDAKGVERLALKEEGWQFWEWNGHEKCHYISAGEDNDGPLVVLVHGFGAHSYHWRYSLPALAKQGFRVYALCMLGYGWSPKADERYCMEFWGQQVIDFTREVAGANESDRAVIAGNSIGALAALYAASKAPEQCRGLCLVNSAGNFEPDAKPGPEKKTFAQRAVSNVRVDVEDGSAEPSISDRLNEAFGRFAATCIFWFTKVRIKQILSSVYLNEVDDELARSIEMATEDPGTLNTFYKISLAGGRTKVLPGDLLQDFSGPVMLLWGEKDPWMTPTKAGRIMEIKPGATYTPVLAGHCPQDDNPEDSNRALAEWVASLPA